MTTFDQHRGETPLSPYLPDLGFTDNTWAWESETDDDDDAESDDSIGGTPGAAILLVIALAVLVLAALTLCGAVALAPLVTR